MSYKNEILNWNDLRLFLAVARGGSLAEAARVTEVSAPTLGRRMYALEHTLGVTLFRRHQEGYDLTSKGRELVIRGEALEEKVSVIEKWHDSMHSADVVRIVAGDWTSLFLARNGDLLCDEPPAIRIKILCGASNVDLRRHEAHLGIRNRRPADEDLVGRRLMRVEYAVYGGNDYVSKYPAARLPRRFVECDWVMYTSSRLKPPSTVWLERNLRRKVKFQCDAPQPVLEAAARGVGLVVLPCFVGDSDPRLTRVSGNLFDLGHDQWLVNHLDDRDNPVVSQVGTRIIKLLNGGGRAAPARRHADPGSAQTYS